MIRIGSEGVFAQALLPCIEECISRNVQNRTQALEYIGSRVRLYRKGYSVGRSSAEEAQEVLAGVVLSHIPTFQYNFRNK